MLAIITYNPLPPYGAGIISMNGRDILILPETFSHNGRKSPHLVTADHPCWQLLMRHQTRLKRIVIFSGKKDSGALEVITLAMTAFANDLDKLYFVLCDHDQKEKIGLIRSLRGNDSHYMCFSDHHRQCQESILLKGFIQQYAEGLLTW